MEEEGEGNRSTRAELAELEVAEEDRKEGTKAATAAAVQWEEEAEKKQMEEQEEEEAAVAAKTVSAVRSDSGEGCLHCPPSCPLHYCKHYPLLSPAHETIQVAMGRTDETREDGGAIHGTAVPVGHSETRLVASRQHLEEVIAGLVCVCNVRVSTRVSHAGGSCGIVQLLLRREHLVSYH